MGKRRAWWKRISFSPKNFGIELLKYGLAIAVMVDLLWLCVALESSLPILIFMVFGIVTALRDLSPTWRQYDQNPIFKLKD